MHSEAREHLCVMVALPHGSASCSPLSLRSMGCREAESSDNICVYSLPLVAATQTRLGQAVSEMGGG